MVWCSFVALFAGEGRKGNFFFLIEAASLRIEWEV